MTVVQVHCSVFACVRVFVRVCKCVCRAGNGGGDCILLLGRCAGPNKIVPSAECF